MDYFALLLLIFVAATECDIVLRPPDIVEMDSKLFILKEGYNRLLADMAFLNEGNFTAWLNEDHAEMKLGSLGDFEWLKRLRTMEETEGACTVPCEDENIIAMQVDILDTDQDNFIMENCLDLEEDARRPQIGFYCMNFMQKKCRSNNQCHQYMTAKCQCPDFVVRYFCKGSAADLHEYCVHVGEEFLNKMKTKKSLLEEEAPGVVDSAAAAADSKDDIDKNLKDLLRELMDELQ